MRVVQFTEPGRVEIVRVAPEPLESGTLRVATRYSGISAGTELTAYRGSNPYLNRVWDSDRRLFLPGDPELGYPLAGWGYSEVGEVVEVAPDVVGQPGIPAVGDMVWGIWGHRDEAVLPADRLAGHTLPDGLDPLAASFARVGAVALNAVLAAGIHLGEVVAVFGQGVIGLLATQLATLNGARVVGVDALPQRLQRSAAWGAFSTLDASRDAVAERIRELSDGRGADTAVELSGSYPALHEAIRSVAVGGRVVASGFYQGEGTGLRLGEEFHHNRVELVSSQIGGVPPHLSGRWNPERLTRTFLRLAADKTVVPEGLVSDLVPASGAAEAYEVLDQRPAEALQIVLDFGKE